MNAREALNYLDEKLRDHYATPFDGIRTAITTLSSVLDKRDASRATLIKTQELLWAEVKKWAKDCKEVS